MKTAFIIDFFDRNKGEFPKAFFQALEDMFDPRQDGRTRVDGYQRIYIRSKSERDAEELLPAWKLVEDTLIEKGYTEKDIILVNNTW